MPPRISLLRPSLRTVHKTIVLRRTLTTRTTTKSASFPSSKSLRIGFITGATFLGVGVGLYSFSRVSNAESQFSKPLSGNENRELIAGSSRKQHEKPGKAEEANKTGGSSQDDKSGLVVDSKKPEADVNKDSKRGKVKGGHDERGQPKDEPSTSKPGRTETDGSAKGESQGAEENGEEEQAQPIDPETGEINWDCPCLGDMPHGVCGEQFRKAFSCFVHSTEEPKGQDCIDAFAEMQDCFRAHPDVYKPLDVLDDDELDDESTEAPETVTEKGDEKLNQKGSGSKNQKQGNSDEPQMEKEKKKSDKPNRKKSNELKEIGEVKSEETEIGR